MSSQAGREIKVCKKGESNYKCGSRGRGRLKQSVNEWKVKD